VKSCIDKFHLRSKVIRYKSDVGGNLKTCQDYLNEMISNDAIFNPSKPIFEQSCLVHALSGACKKAVINAQTGTLSPRRKLQNCITWSQKGCMIFSIFLDPRFVSIKEDLHSHEYRYNLDYKIAYLKPYIQQMKEKLLEYISAAEMLQIQFLNLGVVRVFTCMKLRTYMEMQPCLIPKAPNWKI
jgi:hypothetical protein